MERKEISNAVIKRLPRYHRYLGELMERDVYKRQPFTSFTGEAPWIRGRAYLI